MDPSSWPYARQVAVPGVVAAVHGVRLVRPGSEHKRELALEGTVRNVASGAVPSPFWQLTQFTPLTQAPGATVAAATEASIRSALRRREGPGDPARHASSARLQGRLEIV